MKKVLYLGNFGSNTKLFSGHSLRARSIYTLLEASGCKVNRVDLDDFHSRIKKLKLLLKLALNLSRGVDLIFLTAGYNGTRLMSKILTSLGLKSKLVLAPTGGWFTTEIVDISDIKALLIQSSTLAKSVSSRTSIDVFHLPNFRPNYCSDAQPSHTKGVEGTINFIYNSRVARDKGVFELLDAFEAIISQGYDSRLYIYGQISADIESNFLEKVRSNTRVHYEGTYQQDELSEILSRMHVLVFPSYYPGEGQPGVLLDALFNNMPVVCTDWRFNDELVENNINGFLVPPRNVEKLSQAMLAYIIDRKLIHEHSHKSGKMFSRHDYALIRQKINRLI